MANFTLTSSDEIATPDLVSRTVVATGETLSNGVANKAGILLRNLQLHFRVASEAGRSAHRRLPYPIGRTVDR